MCKGIYLETAQLNERDSCAYNPKWDLTINYISMLPGLALIYSIIIAKGINWYGVS